MLYYLVSWQRTRGDSCSGSPTRTNFFAENNGRNIVGCDT